jgi:hypothetical protein
MDALLTIIVLIVTLKWGDWKHWKQYYPTMLFWALGNFIYRYLTLVKPLWKFTTPILPEPLAEVMMSLVIFPCFILLFLPYFPRKGIVKQILYICLWTFIFSFIEWWALKIGHFAYFDSWNLPFSIIFNFGMFPLLKIHHNEPPWAWMISIVFAVIIMSVFKIPYKI